MMARLLGLAYPLVLLAAGVILTVLLLAEARRCLRKAARDVERAIRPPVTLDDVPLDWCCEAGFLTHGREHEDGRACSR